MLDNMSVQKRVILATVLSFIFFIAYDHFFIPKNLPLDQNQTVTARQSSQTNAAPSANTASGTSAPQAATTQSREIAVIKGEHFEARIDELGRISKFYLNDEKYKNADGERIELAGAQPLPLEVRFSDKALNEQAFKVAYASGVSEINLTSEPKTIVLTQNLEGSNVTKKITFYPNGSYDLDLSVSAGEYYVTPGFRPNVAIDSYTVHGALLKHNDGKLTIIEDGDVDATESFNNVNIAAASDRYYTALFFKFDGLLNPVVSKDGAGNAVIFVKGEQNFKAKGYIGAKDHATLSQINEELVDVIEYGWFTFIAKPMFAFLNWLYGYIGNWGWAIVVLTLAIRIVLFPLTYKGMLSMNKLKDLAPKVKELQAKYKGDPQKLNMHMMELYKKNGANPMGGCLPILMQIPIFFAIYRVLLNAIELKAAPWILWIHDLSVMDPYFVLPILMGATMFLQQKLTPTTFSDPMQEKIMKFLPLIFTFFFVTFPAGLTLYWFVNNLCSVVQQIFVNKLFEKHKKAEVKV